MDHSMHTLDIKYRKESRKVLIKVHLQRKNCGKVQKYVQFLAVLTGGSDYQHESLHLCSESRVGSLHCHCTGFCFEVLILF